MTTTAQLLSTLAQKNEKKIILLVMDGVGDIHTEEFPQTPLEKAATPNLDRLAPISALGRSLPADHGITPGSGPGHLALFGYDPIEEKHQIGRGVPEALGINYEMRKGDVAARGNYCTLGPDGKITDRRAGRPSNEECARVATKLGAAIKEIDGASVAVLPVKEHRFCVIFNAPGLEADLEDTDPQAIGVAPLPARVKKASPGAEKTKAIAQNFIDRSFEVLKDEPKINGLTLRGFSSHPGLPTFEALYHLNPAAIAAYPLYLGVARLAGMKVLQTGGSPTEEFETVAKNWTHHDFFFIHIKKTDSSGEDGNHGAKTHVIEDVDAALPILLGLKPDVLAITGDHSTPCAMKGHSWHPVPLLICAEHCDRGGAKRFTETECRTGNIGTIPAKRLMGLMLGNAGKLAKFGA